MDGMRGLKRLIKISMKTEKQFWSFVGKTPKGSRKGIVFEYKWNVKCSYICTLHTSYTCTCMHDSVHVYAYMYSCQG